MSQSSTKPESQLKQEIKNYQKRTFESFGKASAADKIPFDVQAKLNNKGQLNDFLRKVKEDDKPIQKIIQTMKRVPVVVREPETGKAEKRDFLVVNSEIIGYDWMGNKMRVMDYIEGFHYEPEFKTTYKRNWETGDMIPNTEYTGIKTVYDIELTDKNRKQLIQDIINKSIGTFTENIKFYYQVPDSLKGAGHRDGNYTFDQFINSSAQELENIAWTRPVPKHADNDKKQYHG